MAFCPYCGSQISDGARFCAQCGSSIGPAPQQPAPQPAVQPLAPQPQPHAIQQPQPSGGAIGNPKYQTLGGWLLFFTISWGLSALFNLFGLFTTIAVLGAYLSNGLALTGIVDLVSTIAAMAADVALIVLIIKRHPRFLRLYQILQIATAALALLSFIVDSVTINIDNGAAIIGITLVITIVALVVSLLLMTMYFCKSVRMRTYMGTTEYLDTALFKIGV